MRYQRKTRSDKGVPRGPYKTAAKMADVANERSRAMRPYETDTEISNRIEIAFECVKDLTQATIEGNNRGLIVQGPPGLGKSYIIDSLLEESGVEHAIKKGNTRATGIYKTLYQNQNGIVVYDDCDSLFFDETCLNILKAATDTTPNRVISWGTETKMEDENGEKLPTHFQFNGSVIIATNLDLDWLIQSGSKNSEHYKALISRCHYISLGIREVREYLIRIKQVAPVIFANVGAPPHHAQQALGWLEANSDNLREISLRTLIKICILIKTHPKKWEHLASHSLLRPEE